MSPKDGDFPGRAIAQGDITEVFWRVAELSSSALIIDRVRSYTEPSGRGDQAGDKGACLAWVRLEPASEQDRDRYQGEVERRLRCRSLRNTTMVGGRAVRPSTTFTLPSTGSPAPTMENSSMGHSTFCARALRSGQRAQARMLVSASASWSTCVSLL